MTASESAKTKAIVSVIGVDKVGIIAQTSQLLAECGVNVLDLSQTVLQEYFTMIMLVDLQNATIPFSEISARLSRKGEEIGMAMRIQREDIFRAMHRL